MASPLSVFRKYQYPILVVMGVILMVSFLIVPLIMDYLQSTQTAGGVNQSQVVVHWKGGRMREADLEILFRLHRQTLGFLQTVKEEAEKKKGQPKVELPQPRANDEQLVVMSLMADKARDMGMVISDAALREYLDQLCDQTLDNDDLNRILNETTDGRLTVGMLYSQLRVELLSQHMEQLVYGAVVPSTHRSTPAQNWMRYMQLHRRAVLEMLPLSVAEFLDQVASEPTDQDIADLYEQYKDNFPSPDRPDPGFRRLPKADFGFLKFDFTKFLDEEKQKITEEEIRAEYEKGLKAGHYRIPKLPETTTPSTTDEGDRPPAPPADADHTEPLPPDSDETPAESTSGDEPSNAADADENPPAVDPQSENAAESDESENEIPDVDDSENATQDTAPNCGVLQDPAPTGEQPDADEASAVAAEEQPQDDSSETQPADEESSAAEPQQDEATSSEEPATQTTPGETPPASSDQPPQENKTLEQVRDDIIAKLASPRAQTRLNKVLDEAFKQITSAGNQYRKWEDLRTEEPTLREPQIPSPADLGTKYAVESGRTGLLDYYQMKSTVLGNTSIPSESFPAPAIQFTDVAFQSGLPKYRPVKFNENDDFQVQYIAWKLNETADSIPSLREVREEVVMAWKTQEARKLASRRADELLKQISEAEGPLAERLPEQAEKIFQTNEFAWLRVTNEIIPGTGYGELEISEVENVGVPRPEFMEAVFSKEPGDVGVLKNAGESTFYVFRVSRISPAEERLREMFLAEFRSGGFGRLNLERLAQLDFQQFRMNAVRELFNEYDVVWEQPPQQRLQ